MTYICSTHMRGPHHHHPPAPYFQSHRFIVGMEDSEPWLRSWDAVLIA
jgi:hypothetical protein